MLVWLSYVYCQELPEGLEFADEEKDYRIKVTNRYLKCINEYVNCEGGVLSDCDEIFMKCLMNSFTRHAHRIEKMRKEEYELLKNKEKQDL